MPARCRRRAARVVGRIGVEIATCTAGTTPTVWLDNMVVASRNVISPDPISARASNLSADSYHACQVELEAGVANFVACSVAGRDAEPVTWDLDASYIAVTSYCFREQRRFGRCNARADVQYG